MAAVRHKNSKAELALRRALHARGLRYRLHARDLPGRPDLVFTRSRVAIFVDGDMWHGNAWRLRGLARMEDMFPTRTKWWVSKIDRNVQRDREVDEALTAAGWQVLRVWESAVLKDVDTVARLVVERVAGEARGAPPRRLYS